MSEEKPTPTPRESGERVEGGHAPPEGQQKGHAAPERLQEGHAAPEYRGHQPPESGNLELGHTAPEQIVVVQQVGEMHSPAVAAPEPTQPPPKPSDSAQSVTPPPAPEPAPPQSGDGGND